MEDKKYSKTLKEGYVKSKLNQSQNPYDQTPEEDPVLSEFSKECNGSVLGKNLQIDVNSVTVETSNVEEIGVANTWENGFVEFEYNLEPFKGEDEMKNGLLGSDKEREFLVICNEGSNNRNGSQIDMVPADSVRVEMNATEEVVEKTDDATHIYMSDSSRNVDSISLFVDVFGPLDDIYQVEDGMFSNENVLENGESSENMSSVRGGTLSSRNCKDANVGVSESPGFMLDVINTGLTEEANELDQAVGTDECNFILGDLVWIKTRTNLWWPGVVSDPSNSTKDMGSKKKGSVLVKYFGNANFVWCFPSQLKHFVQCFDELVQQNSSRSFCGAVERAVNEIGRRVREEMTCSCFPKEREEITCSAYTVNGNSLSKQRAGDQCGLSLSRFEPANFLGRIKCLAHDGSVPGKINLIVTQNRLTSFYRSLGHCQLPMNQLRPSDARESAQSGPASDKEFVNQAELMEEKENCGGKVEILIGYNMNSSEIANSGPIKSRGATGGSRVSGLNGGARTVRRSDKGNKSRERKKSKYLSYPYIDPIKDKPTEAQNETEDPKKVSNEGMESNSKNSQKRGPRKSSGGLNAICKPEDIKSSSSEMLSELHLTARDCSNYKERRSSASIKRFISCFRRFAFLNHEIAADGDIGDGLEFSHKDNSSQNLPETQSQKQGTNKGPEDAGEHPSSSGQPKKRRRKKKEAVTSDCMVSFSTMTGAVNGLLGTAAGYNPSSSGQPKKRRRSKKEAVTSEGAASLSTTTDAVNGSLCTDATQTEKVSDVTVLGATAIKPTGQLPNINPSGTNTSVEGLPVPGKRGRKKRKVEDRPTKNGLGWMDLHGKCVKFVDLLKDVQKAGPNVQLLKDMHTSGPSPFTSVLDRNNMVAETEVTSEIMDRKPEASSNHVESSSVVKTLQQTQILNAAANPEKKRRRQRKKSSDLVNNEGNSCIPDLNGNAGDSGSGANNVTDMNSLPNNEKPRRRRRRSKSDTAVPEKALNNVELSGAILLYFASGVSLPSVESLLTTFVGYGVLIESETRRVDDSTAQVVFVQSSDALRAFRSLQENNPFGPSLTGCRLVYLSAPRNSSIPDLNGNVAESGSLGNDVGEKNSVPNKDKPRKRRRRNKVQNEEISGAIMLNFASGVSLPSVESLLTTFVGFGAIKESETRYVNDSTAQVVFVETSDALQAYQSLQGNNPFGSALAGCRFIYLSSSAPSAPKPTKNLQSPQPSLPRNVHKKTRAMPSGLSPKTSDPPDLLTIKKNLEMMKSMLDKAGNNLSPEMRSRLESEIKGLMQKVNSTVGSSST